MRHRHRAGQGARPLIASGAGVRLRSLSMSDSPRPRESPIRQAPDGQRFHRGSSVSRSWRETPRSGAGRPARHRERCAGAFDLAGGAPVRTRELFRAVQPACGTNLTADAGPARPGDLKENWLSVPRAEHRLGCHIDGFHYDIGTKNS